MGKWEPVNPADLEPGDRFKAKMNGSTPQPIDPDDIKVGDRVRWVDGDINCGGGAGEFTVTEIEKSYIDDRLKRFHTIRREWFLLHRPEPEPVTPEEPPVRTPWRVKGGDGIFFQFAEGGMHANLQYAGLFRWFTYLVKPGDEIELLEFRPVGEGNE